MSEHEEIKRAMRALERSVVGADEPLSEAVLTALGRLPAGLGLDVDEGELREALERICYPTRWRDDLPGLTYFFKALHQLVRERGGTHEAARSVRHELQTGKLHAVFILEDGRQVEIEPHRWLMSEQLWWSGCEVTQPDSSGRASRGYVYVVDRPSGADSPPAADEAPRYTPPFMQLMFEAIRHFEMPDKLPNADTLQVWFEGRQIGGGRVSQAQARYLATFVRPPDAMRGGNKRMSGSR